MKATFALAFALLVGSYAAGNAAFQGGGHPGGMTGSHMHMSTQASMVPHNPVTQLKIRTPRQCFRYCRGTLGAGVSFCAVSCYR